MKTLLTTIAASLALTGCASIPTTSSPTATPQTVTVETPYLSHTITAPITDPYSTDGQWLVPSEIEAGDYRAIQTDTAWGGYVKICRDTACQIGTPGFVDNAIVTGSAIIHIPADAQSIQIQRVKLERLA